MEFYVLECRKGAPKYHVSMYMHAHRLACRPTPPPHSGHNKAQHLKGVFLFAHKS